MCLLNLSLNSYRWPFSSFFVFCLFFFSLEATFQSPCWFFFPPDNISEMPSIHQIVVLSTVVLFDFLRSPHLSVPFFHIDYHYGEIDFVLFPLIELSKWMRVSRKLWLEQTEYGKWTNKYDANELILHKNVCPHPQISNS